MRQKNEQEFKTYAAEVLAGIYGMNDYERVLDSLKECDDTFFDVPSQNFGLEYLAARLSLASHAWVRGCQENYVENRAVENIFFKTVMNSFQSEKFVQVAKAYSEYLHAPEVEKHASLAVGLMLMKRLGIGQKLMKDGKPVLLDSFQMLVSAAESFKEDIENKFFDFVFAVE